MERRLAGDLFKGVWQLLDGPDRTAEEDERMLRMAHASRYHWDQVGTAENRCRGEWQCSRVYAVLGRAEPALHHANRSLEICHAHGIGDFDLAFAYEALARASAVAGDGEQARPGASGPGPRRPALPRTRIGTSCSPTWRRSRLRRRSRPEWTLPS